MSSNLAGSASRVQNHKRYFTIFDYSGASQLEDAEFDGHAPTPTITIGFALIWLSTRTPLSAAGRKQLDHLQLSHSSADSIANMSGWLKW
ncbi:MAG: hypothetical protein QOJ15_6364 [Bradyrhizobium sp.]|nr:hypothetical protein [Bradyrhizobium sp.]